MSWLMLSDVARMLGAELHGADVAVDEVSTDTRSAAPGALFFALQGPNFDAHKVLDDNPRQPLAALVVSRPVKHPAPYLLVDDTRKALGRLAAAWRQQLDVRVIGLTGSNGKTTVKEMLASICSVEGPTLATRGNLNNDIGVPLTLLRLRPEHRYAVVEMGANHPGEIAWLTALVRPDVALLINAGGAHLEGFGSIEAVAEAKGEIFRGLDEDGIAVINEDSPFAAQWKALNRERRIRTFGEAASAHCRVTDFSRPAFDLHGWRIAPRLRLLGRHNVLNAAAAAAAALAAGLSVDAVEQGLAAVAPVGGRLCRLAGPSGSTLIDDSYNANPASVAAAIDVLAARPGRRYLVLGDMAELGNEAESLHAGLGTQAKAQGLDGLLTLGPLSAAAAAAFGAGGIAFDDLDSLVRYLRHLLADDVTVLVKGSRSAAMERVIEALGNGEGDNGNGEEKSHAA